MNTKKQAKNYPNNIYYTIKWPTLQSWSSELAGRSSWYSVGKSRNVIVKNYYLLSETGSLNKSIKIIKTLSVDQDSSSWSNRLASPFALKAGQWVTKCSVNCCLNRKKTGLTSLVNCETVVKMKWSCKLPSVLCYMLDFLCWVLASTLDK